MPRKRRLGKARTGAAPLSPALEYLVMSGARAPARLPGWVGLDVTGAPPIEDQCRAAWEQHGARLMDVARAHGFTPAGVVGTMPTGAGFRRWRDRFLEQHTY